MWTYKTNDLRPPDVKPMANVPWTVDSGREKFIDQNPNVKKHNVQRSEQIPSFLIGLDGKSATGKRPRGKKYGKKTDGVLGKIARKEAIQNQVTIEKVVATYQGIQNCLPDDAKRIKKSKKRSSRPRTVR